MRAGSPFGVYLGASEPDLQWMRRDHRLEIIPSHPVAWRSPGRDLNDIFGGSFARQASMLQRLHQQQFRRLVLSAYREQCAICRLRRVQLLDAAHILPERHSKGIADVPNGLGLCKIHHSAYDSNIIGIDAAARIHVREDILPEKDGPMLKYGIQETAGERLILARHDASKPNPEFLAERFERFRAA
jgi:predicted restriction endonuclease